MIQWEGTEIEVEPLMGTGVVAGGRRPGIVAAVEPEKLDSGDTTAFLEDTGPLVSCATAVEKIEPPFVHTVASPEAAGLIVEIGAAGTEETDTGWVDIAASPAAVGL